MPAVACRVLLSNSENSEILARRHLKNTFSRLSTSMITVRKMANPGDALCAADNDGKQEPGVAAGGGVAPEAGDGADPQDLATGLASVHALRCIVSPLNRRFYADRCLSHLNLGWYILHVEITRGGGEELSADYRSAVLEEWRAESAVIEERLEDGAEGKSRGCSASASAALDCTRVCGCLESAALHADRTRRADEAPRLLDFQALLRVCARLQEQGFDFDAPEGSREYGELASEFDHAAPGTPTVSLREFLRWSESEQGMCSECADPCTCAIAVDSGGAVPTPTLVHADDHFDECSSTYEGVPRIVSKHFLPWDAPRQRPPPDPYAHGLAHLALDLGWSESDVMALLRKDESLPTEQWWHRYGKTRSSEWEGRYSPSLLGCNEYDNYGEILQPRIDPRTLPRTFQQPAELGLSSLSYAGQPITFTLLFSDLDDENLHRHDPCNSNTYALHLWAQETNTFPNPEVSSLWGSELLELAPGKITTPARGLCSLNDGLGRMLDYMQLWFERSSPYATWQSTPAHAEALPWSDVEHVLRQAFYRGGLGGHTAALGFGRRRSFAEQQYAQSRGGRRSFAEVLRERVLPYDSKRLWTSAIAEYAAAKLRVFHPDALVTWTSFCWFAEAREWQAPPVNPENLARATQVVRHCRAQRRLPFLLLRSRLSIVDSIGDAAGGGGDAGGGADGVLAALAGGVSGGGSGGNGGGSGGDGDDMDDSLDCGGGLSALLQWLFATSPDFAFQSVLRFIEA